MVEIAPAWTASERRRASGRRAFYLSAEYLVGRMVFNNLLAMGALEEVRALLDEKGVDLSALEDVEDMALGNGGLGRLAAAFWTAPPPTASPWTVTACATSSACSARLSKTAARWKPRDDWTKWGDSWSVRRDDLAVTVPMRTGDVVAVPLRYAGRRPGRTQHRHAAALAG